MIWYEDDSRYREPTLKKEHLEDFRRFILNRKILSAVCDEEKNQTVVGRYDAKNFAIKSVLTVPEISLNSMQIRVDEKAGKVYFIYRVDYFGETHLLSLPPGAK